MLTKREACLAVIGEYCTKAGIGPEDLVDGHVYTSSKLAVAMEYLSLIKRKKAKEYAASRGGTLEKAVLYYFSDSGVRTLSFREILSLLPEDEKKTKIKWRDVKTSDSGHNIKWRDIK